MCRIPRKFQDNEKMKKCNHLFSRFCETFPFLLLCPKAGNVSRILYITYLIIAVREFLDNRLFVCVASVRCVLSLICLLWSHWAMFLYPHEWLCIFFFFFLLLLLISFSMTRLSEKAFVLCFQLTLGRISETWPAQLGCRLLLSLSAALALNLPCILFKHLNTSGLLYGIIRLNR